MVAVLFGGEATASWNRIKKGGCQSQEEIESRRFPIRRHSMKFQLLLKEVKAVRWYC